MLLTLSELPPTLRGPNDAAYKGLVPKRARFLDPQAARSLLAMNDEAGGDLIFTDVFRSPEASLAAVQAKRGAQRPGWSGHNFGFSVDFDVDATLRLKKWSYDNLNGMAERHGFYCHRRDGRGPTDYECWHFNFLGADAPTLLNLADAKRPATWAGVIESVILSRYARDFNLSPVQVQEALQKLRLYRGDLDGKLGPISREAILAFQRAWLMPPTGFPDSRMQRTLALVAAERRIVAIDRTIDG